MSSPRSVGIFFLVAAAFVVPEAVAKTKKGSVYSHLDIFSKVLYYIESEYVLPVKDEVLIEGAIEGMLATLDPHSLYLPAEHFRELQIDTEGKFGGVGLEITVKEGWLTVVAPLEGTPADRAGIQAGDRILKINGKSTKVMTLSEAVNLMRGKRGTAITFLVGRGEGRPAFEVRLKREIIRVRSVRTEMPEEGWGYLRISSFQETTAAEVERGLAKLESETKLKGLVLDLRNNPGGLLDEAVLVSDLFLSKGKIVTIRKRKDVSDVKEASLEGKERIYPVVALVNGGSASAAEIVAGALQDNKRARLVGTRTFGKGSVQTVFDLGDGSALKLTIAKYYTPSGRSIQDEGIQPDVVVPLAEREISGPSGAPVSPEADYQKVRAFELLKGM